MARSLTLRAWIVSTALLLVFIGIWQIGTLPKTGSGATAYADPEYAALMGGASTQSAGLPTPAAVGQTFVQMLSNPFYDNGPNDKGIGIQLGWSLARVLAGFFLAFCSREEAGFVENVVCDRNGGRL